MFFILSLLYFCLFVPLKRLGVWRTTLHYIGRTVTASCEEGKYQADLHACISQSQTCGFPVSDEETAAQTTPLYLLRLDTSFCHEQHNTSGTAEKMHTTVLQIIFIRLTKGIVSLGTRIDLARSSSDWTRPNMPRV